MYRYMKVGVVHFMAYPETMKGEGPILETLEKIAEDEFFTAVEISQIKDEKIRKKARKLLDASHLAIVYLAHPTLLAKQLDLNSFDPKETRRAVDEVKSLVNEAYEMGAVELLFLSGKDPGKEIREEARRLLVSSIKEICSYAKSRGNLGLAMEPFDREIDKKHLIGPVEEARAVAEEVRKDFDNFGLVVDLSHLPLLNETPDQAIRPAKDYIVHAHIGNCVLGDKNHIAYGDQHPRFGIEGGKNDVEELVEFLRVLLDVDFLNTKNPPIVSFEVRPLPGELSGAVIANAKRVLREAWAKV